MPGSKRGRKGHRTGTLRPPAKPWSGKRNRAERVAANRRERAAAKLSSRLLV